ncbi:unnamed protein product, partial [marine sediment metagenome]
QESSRRIEERKLARESGSGAVGGKDKQLTEAQKANKHLEEIAKSVKEEKVTLT